MQVEDEISTRGDGSRSVTLPKVHDDANSLMSHSLHRDGIGENWWTIPQHPFSLCGRRVLSAANTCQVTSQTTASIPAAVMCGRGLQEIVSQVALNLSSQCSRCLIFAPAFSSFFLSPFLWVRFQEHMMHTGYLNSSFIFNFVSSAQFKQFSRTPCKL